MRDLFHSDSEIWMRLLVVNLAGKGPTNRDLAPDNGLSIDTGA